MFEKFIDSRNRGRPFRVRLQRLLYAVLLLSSQTSYALSFTWNSQQKKLPIRKNRLRVKGTTCDCNRYPSLRASIADDNYVEDTQSLHIDTSHSTPGTHIIFPGGGIFFYYQAGLVNFLRERYDMSSCTFSGASAGALTATLTAADVDFYEATDLALKLAKSAGVWDRKGGLQGIWGPMIEEWLELLLPTCIDALQDRITLLVTPVPSFGKTKISRFENKKDLIQCNMASVHLPWFLDGKLTSNFRGQPHIDGSFLAREDDYSPGIERQSNTTIDTIVLDWNMDPEMRSKGGLDIVEALSPDGIYGLMERGKRFGKVLEDQGLFDSLEKLP